MRRVILVILYFILLGVGIYEAYRGDWVVALFWAKHKRRIRWIEQ